VLLAYYIAAVNIEEAFRGHRGGDKGYEPFEGIVLTDTFNLNKPETPSLFPKDWLPENNERAENQEKLPIQVIIGNPPWSAGQKDATDDNANVDYPEWEQRITETYAARATTTLKRHLYDTYKMALRWASDRIENQGIVAFVTPASWIDGNVDSGVRACLADEFNSVYVLNLLGNARVYGAQGRLQGEGVFGNATQSPVAITILVKNLNTSTPLSREDQEGLNANIRYRDIGGNLKRDQKLNALREAVSINGFDDWQEITPNTHHDWINQRSDAFTTFYPLGTSEAKAGEADDAIFQLYSLGVSTNRDAYIYNFSREACAENARRMTDTYLSAIAELEANPEMTVEEVARRHATNIKWDDTLIKRLAQKKKTEFKVDYIRKAAYRPFIATNCYADEIFITRKGQMDQIFPESSSENRVICATGVGSKIQFSAFMTDMLPDLELISKGKCFPRWRYAKIEDTDHQSLKLLNIYGGGKSHR